MSAKAANNLNSLPRSILVAAKFLEIFAPKLLILFAARLFTTPVKHKVPKREYEMQSGSVTSRMHISSINKEITVYQYGSAARKILLMHGWSGRGTQLSKIADALLKNGYSVVSFDAPAHGKSTGRTTLMPEFVASIMQIDLAFGPFEAAIGHSLGGMSLLSAVKRGLNIKSLVIIGSGDIVQDIIDDFIAKLQVASKYSDLLRKHFERTSGESMNNYSAYVSAAEISIPTLVIHDNGDDEVPVSSAINIHKHLKNGELLLTNNLGHRKILGDAKVIQKIITFITLTHDENEVDVTPDNTIADRVPRPTT